MKNLIKISTVSMIACTLMFGAVGSAMAVSKFQNNKRGYTSFKKSSSPSRSAMRAPLRNGGQGQIVNGGGRTTGTAKNVTNCGQKNRPPCAKALEDGVAWVGGKIKGAYDFIKDGLSDPKPAPPRIKENGGRGRLAPK